MKCRLFVSGAIAPPFTFVGAHAARRSYKMLVTISELLALLCISCGGGGMPKPPRALLSIIVQPSNGNATAPIGTLPFTATGTFNQSPITQTDLSVQWSSSDTSIASIDPKTGLATCVSVAGEVTVMITATADGKQGTAQLTCFSPQIPAKLFGKCVSVCTGDDCRLTGYCSGVIDACYEGYDPQRCPAGQPAGMTATDGCGVLIDTVPVGTGSCFP